MQTPAHPHLKIAIDAFALAFTQGSGVTRYAIELAKALAERHEVTALYELVGVDASADLRWASFVQSLILRGEISSRDWTTWGYYAARYSLKYLLGRPVRARPVLPDDRIDVSSIAAQRLPGFGHIYNAPAIYRAAQAYARVFRRPLRIRLGVKPPDIWHLTLPMPVMVAGAKCVVTAHDLIHIALPHSTEVDLSHYRRLVAQTFKSADMIFAVSEYTKRDLLAHFAIPERKIFVTYQCADIPKSLIDAKTDDVATLLRKAFGLKYGKYFLFYGQIEPKKNVARIVEAACAAQTDMPIVIAGRGAWLDGDVTALIKRIQATPGGRRRVVRIEYLPYDQLMFLVKGARALVFPSLYEGFGIPLLEAMQMGCPIITSNSTSLAEIGADAALYVDPTKTREIMQAIDSLAVNDDLRMELITRGHARAQSFSRDRYITKLDEGYKLALGA